VRVRHLSTTHELDNHLNFIKVDEWLALSGTSMASLFVAGVVGLMLAIQPKITAAQSKPSSVAFC